MQLGQKAVSTYLSVLSILFILLSPRSLKANGRMLLITDDYLTARQRSLYMPVAHQPKAAGRMLLQTDTSHLISPPP